MGRGFIIGTLLGVLVLIIFSLLGIQAYANQNASNYSAKSHHLLALIQIQESQGLPKAKGALLKSELNQRESSKFGPFLRVQIDSQYGPQVIAQVGANDSKYWQESLDTEKAIAISARLDMEKAEGERVASSFKSQRDSDLLNASTPNKLSLLSQTWLLHSQVVPLDNQISNLQSTSSSNLHAALEAGILPSPLPELLAQIETYKSLDDDKRLLAAPDLIKSLTTSDQTIKTRLSNALLAKAALASAQAELDNAQAKNIDTSDLTSSLNSAKSELATASDYTEVISKATKVSSNAKDRISALAVSPDSPPTSAPKCITTASTQLIIVDLTNQQLTAYDHGCVFVSTYITSGQVALPTDTGDFHIFKKRSPFQFISPWPYSSRFWYASAWTSYAMEIVSDGTFLHDAPWQPAGTYGPGSQYGPYASHGCIHVPYSVMEQLYNWALLGAEVQVHY